MMKKLLVCAGFSALCTAVLLLNGCMDESSDSGKDALMLLGLNSMTEEEAAFTIATALPATPDMTVSSGEGSGSGNVAPTKKMIAEISKNASAAFLRSELSVPAAREAVSIVIDDTCEAGTCYTLSGTGACSNGGSMTFNGLTMSLDMTSEDDTSIMTGAMDGSVTYAHCGGRTQSWFTYPKYVYAVIDGTVAQHDQMESTVILLAGDILSGSYAMSSGSKGARTVTSESVTVNGRNFTQVDLDFTTDLLTNSQVSNYTFASVGNILTISGDYVDTITGRVAVDGALGPENEVHAERIFNTETFRYHSSCRMDTENFSVNCSVRKM